MANVDFTELQKDAIGEIMNISMGSAATAASELLSAKVWITTPRVSVQKAGEIKYDNFEPAVCIKIEYIKGISGSSLMVWKQGDVQLILNQLMGQPLAVTDDFEFDDLNISAVSEIMNQMMGAGATALSNFLNISIDISTPTPYIMQQVDLSDIQSLDPQDDVVAITFDLTIEGVIRSEFVTVMEMEFAKKLSERLVNMQNEEPAPAPEPQPATPRAAQADIQSPIHQQPSVQQQVPQQDPAPGMYPPPPYPYAMPGYGYQQPYPYPYPQPQQAPVPPQSPVNVQQVQLHQFESFDNVSLTGDQKENLKLLMSVPLEVSVEIGSAHKKVKEILEFQQGTIIELERQAGAPVDVVVNGNLIARGDVVVVDDNFAVRITEIVKSKFMDSLGKE